MPRGVSANNIETESKTYVGGRPKGAAVAASMDLKLRDNKAANEYNKVREQAKANNSRALKGKLKFICRKARNNLPEEVVINEETIKT